MHIWYFVNKHRMCRHFFSQKYVLCETSKLVRPWLYLTKDDKLTYFFSITTSQLHNISVIIVIQIFVLDKCKKNKKTIKLPWNQFAVVIYKICYTQIDIVVVNGLISVVSVSKIQSLSYIIANKPIKITNIY